MASEALMFFLRAKFKSTSIWLDLLVISAMDRRMESNVALLNDKDWNAWNKKLKVFQTENDQRNLKTYGIRRVATLVNVSLQIVQADFESFEVVSHLGRVTAVVKQILDAVDQISASFQFANSVRFPVSDVNRLNVRPVILRFGQRFVDVDRRSLTNGVIFQIGDNFCPIKNKIITNINYN